MSNRRGQAGIVIFVLCIVLLIAVVLLVIYLFGRNDPVKLAEPNVTGNKTYYNVTVGSNALLPLTYELDNATHRLVVGTLYPSILERYDGGVEANTTVSLSAWSKEYYFNQTICNITREKYPCALFVKPKALDFVLNLSEKGVTIDPLNGTLQAPVLLCFAEHFNVQNVLMSLPAVGKPADLRWNVDFCYVVQQDISSRVVYPIVVHRNEVYNATGNLTVLVRDFEVAGHENVGDKFSSVVVS